MFNDRRKLPRLADPQLQGQYPMRGLYQALAIASMCIQEQAAARPLIGDVVTALSYLSSQSYNTNAAPAHNIRVIGEKDDKRSRGGGIDGQEERGGRVARNEEGGESGRKLDGSEKEDSPRETARILIRNLDRERAVAEAKMWGENWREKRRANVQGSSDGAGRQ